MFPTNSSYCGNGGQDDVYEKWLRRRMDYAVIRETGNHAAPGFVHTILHSGNSYNKVASEIREEMWRNNKYPDSSFFQHGQVLYGYPPYIKEVLDLRFVNTPLQKERCPLNPVIAKQVYNLSLKEVTTIPNWIGPLLINNCPYPHVLETPLTWTLGQKPGSSGIQSCHDPSRMNKPVFPECCHRPDDICSAVYCRDPLPEVTYLPGPLGRGEAHFKWHLNHPEGKRRVILPSDKLESKIKKPTENQYQNPCQNLNPCLTSKWTNPMVASKKQTPSSKVTSGTSKCPNTCVTCRPRQKC